MTRLILGLALGLVAGASPCVAQADPFASDQRGALPERPTGADVYRAACVTCHGPDGTGSPPEVVGFTVELPDFSDCAFSSAEPDADWQAVVHEGGPIRGLDRHMPAFGDALSPEHIALAVESPADVLHGSRVAARRPEPAARVLYGEGVPRERIGLGDDVARPGGQTSIANDLIYERRIGARNQVELVAPLNFQRGPDGEWSRGFGDLALAFNVPCTPARGRGGSRPRAWRSFCPPATSRTDSAKAIHRFEPFAMWGQMLPKNSFLQMHGGVEIPTADHAKAKLFLRTSLGTTVAQDRGFGRAWSPQVEVLWASAEGDAVRMGRRATGASDAVEASARDGCRRREDSSHPTKRAADADASSISSGTGSTAASSSSGNDASDDPIALISVAAIRVCAVLFVTAAVHSSVCWTPSRRTPALHRRRRCSPQPATVSRAITVWSLPTVRMCRSAPRGEAP